MKKTLLTIFLLLGVAQSLKAQDGMLAGWTQLLVIPDKSEAYIVGVKHDFPMPAAKLIKKISIKHDFIKKTKKTLIQECGDSLRYYGGNCFKITFYDDAPVILGSGLEFPDHMRGEIYALDEREINDIRKPVNGDLSPEEELEQNPGNARKPGEVFNAINLVLQYGGESKFAFLLPKFNLLRKHHFRFAAPYYGVEIGPHLDFSLRPAYGSLSGIFGIEKSFFSTETSLSYFKMVDGYSQTLLNLKFGIGIEEGKIKIGRSFLLQEFAPEGEERNPLLDAGKINGQIWGIELQFRIAKF